MYPELGNDGSYTLFRDFIPPRSGFVQQALSRPTGLFCGGLEAFSGSEVKQRLILSGSFRPAGEAQRYVSQQ